MKCECGLEMELWQTTLYEGNVIKRWRCACGEEKTDITYREKPKVEVVETTKSGDEYRSWKKKGN